MKKISILFSIAIVMIVCTGGQKKEDTLLTEKITTYLQSNSIYSHKQKIVLRLPKNCLISGLVGVEIGNTHILGLSREGVVYLWTITGDYCSKVGNIGKGPGEYTTNQGNYLFIGQNEIGVFDRQRNLLNIYSMSKPQKVEFVDDVDLSLFAKWSPSEIKYNSDKLIFYYPYGLKGSSMIVVADKNFTNVNKLHKLDKTKPTLGTINAFQVINGAVIYRSPLIQKGKRVEFETPYIYMISIGGKKIRDIKCDEHMIFNLDSSGKVIFAENPYPDANVKTRIYSVVSGKLLYESTDEKQTTFGFINNDLQKIAPFGRICNTGVGNSYLVKIENPQDNTINLHVFELFVGLE